MSVSLIIYSIISLSSVIGVRRSALGDIRMASAHALETIKNFSKQIYLRMGVRLFTMCSYTDKNGQVMVSK